MIMKLKNQRPEPKGAVEPVRKKETMVCYGVLQIDEVM
jgi:hypothetical protein